MVQPDSNSPLTKAMVVVAHPDDAEYGCSGSVARFNRAGFDCVYVICTDGGKGIEDRSLTSQQLTALRKKEQNAAGKILGLKTVEFLDFPDGELEPNLALRKAITRQIRKHRPQIVITTTPRRELLNMRYIGHPDHFAAGEATLAAVFPAARDHLNFPDLLTNEKLEPWKVHEVWIMMGPDLRADIDFINALEKDDVDRSIRALLAHKSQIADPERAKGFMVERRREIGQRIGAGYAESFKRYILV